MNSKPQVCRRQGRSAPLLYVGATKAVADVVAARFGERITVARCLIGCLTPTEVLIAEIGALSPNDALSLELLSRLMPRPSLVLLDDGHTSRAVLARIAADALLPLDAPADSLIRTIESCVWDTLFRLASGVVKLNCPYPLSRYFSAALISHPTSVRLLAQRLGLSQSTLREQWGRIRADAGIRLEDVLHRIRDLRAHLATTPPDWVMVEIATVVLVMTGSREAAKTYVDAVAGLPNSIGRYLIPTWNGKFTATLHLHGQPSHGDVRQETDYA